MTGSPRDPTERIRAAIIYQHYLLRDVIVRVLSTAGVAVVATLRVEELSPETLQSVRPDVVVVDQALENLSESLSHTMLFSSELESATRVITVGLAKPVMVVFSKQLVLEATAQSLIEAVLGVIPDAVRAPASEA